MKFVNTKSGMIVAWQIQKRLASSPNQRTIFLSIKTSLLWLSKQKSAHFFRYKPGVFKQLGEIIAVVSVKVSIWIANLGVVQELCGGPIDQARGRERGEESQA